MNKDQIKGKVEEIKGDVKQRIGGATKDRSTQAEGWMEEQKGKVRGKFGDLKEGADKPHHEEMERDKPSREEP